VLAYAAVVALCLGTLIEQGELSGGRNPWANLVKSVGEFSRPSFLDLWFGERRVEYRSDDGTLLRVEDRRASESRYVAALGEATWTTFRIATLGSLLGALLALPFGLLSARNLRAPRRCRGRPRAYSTWRARSTRWCSRWCWWASWGSGRPRASSAIGLHSMGTYGKLFAESIETLDMRAVEAVRATGASPLQVFFNAVWPGVLPQFVSSHLYIWEYNIRDSTVLG
jgi:ABC-type phosphate/phosphonate transport system permease subunit